MFKEFDYQKECPDSEISDARSISAPLVGAESGGYGNPARVMGKSEVTAQNRLLAARKSTSGKSSQESAQRPHRPTVNRANGTGAGIWHTHGTRASLRQVDSFPSDAREKRSLHAMQVSAMLYSLFF